jgi:hypothetical protein
MSTVPCPPFLSSRKWWPPKLKYPGIGNGLPGSAPARFECRQGHERLVRRTRRIGAVQGAVEHRPVARFVEHIPVLGADTVDEQVRVESGAGDQRQDAASRRLDGHQRAAAIAKCFFGDFLQFDVQGQGQVVALHRRRTRQTANGSAAGVDFDLLVAGLAVQGELVMVFEAGLADMVGTLVVCCLLALGDLFEIALVDAIDVADGVRGHRSQGILTKQARLDFDPREEIAIGGKARDFLLGQARTNGQAFEALALLQQLAKAPLILAGFDVNHFTQAIDRRFQILDIRRRDFQREGRVIACQDDAGAIDDDPRLGTIGTTEMRLSSARVL